VQSDPIGILGGVQLFDYSKQTPNDHIDPHGLVSLPRRTPSGNRPPNHAFAGKTFPAACLPRNIRGKYSHGVPFNAQGDPDFARYSIAKVLIKPSRTRTTDNRRADKEAASAAPEVERTNDYVWHHSPTQGEMILIPRDLHDAVKHQGGFCQQCK